MDKNWESSCEERREGISNCSPFSVLVIAIEIISSVFYYCPRVLSITCPILRISPWSVAILATARTCVLE